LTSSLQSPVVRVHVYRRWARGLTLLEMLAVVTLLGFCAALVVGFTGSSRGGESLTAMAGAVQDFDARARVCARQYGPVRMSRGSDGRTLVLKSVVGGDPIFEIDPGPSIEWSAVSLCRHSADPDIVFDAAGRSDDYLLRIQQGSRSLTLHVAGLTGWITMEEPR